MEMFYHTPGGTAFSFYLQPNSPAYGTVRLKRTTSRRRAREAAPQVYTTKLVLPSGAKKEKVLSSCMRSERGKYALYLSTTQGLLREKAAGGVADNQVAFQGDAPGGTVGIFDAVNHGDGRNPPDIAARLMKTG